MHKDDLAVGPLEARLQSRVGDTTEPKKVRLLFLTRDVIAFQEYHYNEKLKQYASEPNEHIQVFRSNGGNPIVEIRVGETLWEQKEVPAKGGGTLRQFIYRKGPLVMPRSLDFQPREGTPETRRALLVFLQELNLVELESAANSQDKARYDSAGKVANDLAKQAEALSKERVYLGAFQTEKALVRLYQCRQELARERVKLQKVIAEGKRQTELNNSIKKFQELLNGLDALAGADEDGIRGAIPGLAGLVKTERDRVVGNELIRLSTDLKLNEISENMSKLTEEFERLLDARWAAVQECFTVALQLDRTKFDTLRNIIRTSTQPGGRANALSALGNRWRIAAKSGYCDLLGLMIWADCQAKSLLSLETKGDARFKEAEELYSQVPEVLAAVELLPNDPGTGPLRAEALLVAAKLTRDVVAHHRYPKSWSEAFDVRADTGLRIAREAMKQCKAQGAVATRVAAVQAALMLQRGLKMDALNAVESARKEHNLESDFEGRYTLARIHGANGNTTNTRNHFIASAGMGQVPLDRLYGDDDFEPIHGKGKGLTPATLWWEYEHPSLVVRYSSVGVGNLAKLSFEIENTGSLPLVNAKLFVGTARDPQRDKSRLGELDIAYLRPKSKEIWVSDIPAGNLTGRHQMYVAFVNRRQTFKNGLEKEGVFSLQSKDFDYGSYFNRYGAFGR